MNTSSFFKYTLCMALIGCSGVGQAGGLPGGWQILPPAAEDVDRGLPTALQSQELAKDGRRLASVDILVDLPYSEVMPIVASALRQLGPVNDEIVQQPLARLSDEWGEVLLSRRPDLVKALVQQVALPKLQRDVSDGALAESEVPAQTARIERTLRFQSGSEQMAPLTQPYRYWRGNIQTQHGALGNSKSNLVASVTQLDAVFGRPTSVVHLTRAEQFPNAKAGMASRLKALVNPDPFSPTSPRQLERYSVPQALFSPVYDALSALPRANVQLGAEPAQWRAPASPAPRVTEPTLTFPDNTGRTLQADAAFAVRSADAFTVLADDAILLYRNYLRALLYWSPATDGEPREVWARPGRYSQPQLTRDPDGTSAYLALEGLVVHFDAATSTLATHPVVYDAAQGRGHDNMANLHDGAGIPLRYRHDYRKPRDTLDVWQPAARPHADGSEWTYTLRYSTPRQDMMKGPARTNSQIKPVRWDGLTPTAWVEDLYGLTELDIKTGHALRAVKLPRRFGKVDAQDDSGMAQWTPEPFGSAKGGWIAVGFVLMEGQQRTPGLHVVDIASGKVRYSLALPKQETLTTATGSPDGRMLAMGTGGPDGTLVLWDLQRGRSMPLQTDHAECGGIEQLQWNPSGTRLWGRCAKGLVVWDVSGR